MYKLYYAHVFEGVNEFFNLASQWRKPGGTHSLVATMVMGYSIRTGRLSKHSKLSVWNVGHLDPGDNRAKDIYSFLLLGSRAIGSCHPLDVARIRSVHVPELVFHGVCEGFPHYFPSSEGWQGVAAKQLLTFCGYSEQGLL